MIRDYKKKIIIGFMLAICVGLVGCGKEDKTETKQKGDYKIYYPSKSKTKIVSDYVDIVSTDVDAIINELIIKLKEGNYEKSKVAVIPEDVEYATYTLEADILTITFDDNYLKLSGLEEVLKRASIVYTMTQLDDVDYVRMQVNGQPLSIDGEEEGDMSRATFMDLVGEKSDKIIEDKVKLYFADSSGKRLRVLECDVSSDGTVMKEELIIRKLIEGPKGSDRLGYYMTINPETQINRVAVNDKVCYIDFNEAFLERRNGVSEEVVIYSIVDSLTELSTVNQVRITVNGEVREIYNEYANMGGFIEKNYDIISYEK